MAHARHRTRASTPREAAKPSGEATLGTLIASIWRGAAEERASTFAERSSMSFTTLISSWSAATTEIERSRSRSERRALQQTSLELAERRRVSAPRRVENNLRAKSKATPIAFWSHFSTLDTKWARLRRLADAGANACVVGKHGRIVR
eukprot:4846123-Pleurochrysis_carterae.AAC.1